MGIDDVSYANRFTPRRARSTWSTANVNRVKELKRQGRVHPAGLSAFEKRLATLIEDSERGRTLVAITPRRKP